MGIVIAMLLVGIALAFVGYGPLSLRRHPKAGSGVAIAGFFVRLAALLLIIIGVLLLVSAAAFLWHLP
jgi:hypothetical protein